jgi:centromeric protein E
MEEEGEWMVDGRRSLISYRGREGGDYLYDNVFSPYDQNARVYDSAAKRLVRRVMEGYHGTVFAYGMTGTGKTFSMQGTANSPGVIPLAITDIFSYIRENPSREFLLRVSYLEIYNEKIYDLLNAGTPANQQEEIKLREDSKRGVYATPLKEEIVQSPNQLLRVIARGDLARRTSSTQFNARSSRSHAVVQIVVESRARTQDVDEKTTRKSSVMPGGVLVSTLSLIDLAGSEKAADSKERRTEGAHINKSLLTLGTVIGRLSGEEEKDEKDGAKAADREKVVKHLPYRDSKLTRLLQPALSGDSLVSILCTIQLSASGSSAAQASSHTGETLNTLKFASRAKNNIVSHAKKNESHATAGDPGSRALLDRYRIEIQELRTQLEQQNRVKDQNEKLDEFEQDRKMEEELERQERTRHEEQMLEMQLARTALKERISHLNRLILSSKSLGVNSGRFSSTSLPFDPRSSVISNSLEYSRPASIRSRNSSQHLQSQRESLATTEVPSPSEAPDNTALSSGSVTTGTMPAARRSQLVDEETPEDATLGNPTAEDEEDLTNLSGGDNGDGTATLTQQNRMLQADLADKNRYIATLEKRLLQARRTSHSRVSMHFAGRASLPTEEVPAGNLEALVRQKDRELDELRQKLDDQVRMVSALRNAARKREMRDSERNNVPAPIATAISTPGEEDAVGSKSLVSTPNENLPAEATSDSVPDLNTLPFSSASSSTTRQDRHLSSSSRATSRLSSAKTTPPNTSTATMGGASHRSTPSNATNGSRTSSIGGSGVVNFSKTPLSPVAILSAPSSPSREKNGSGLGLLGVLASNGAGQQINGTGDNAAVDGSSKLINDPKRRKSVDEMTALLDQMIQDKVESGHVVRGDRGSLRVKSQYLSNPSLSSQYLQQDAGAERKDVSGLAVKAVSGGVVGGSPPIREMKEEELREMLREDLRRAGR